MSDVKTLIKDASCFEACLRSPNIALAVIAYLIDLGYVLANEGALVTPDENITLIAVTDTIQPLTTDTTKTFKKLWLYPAKAVSATTGALTANTAIVNVGKSATYLPDPLDTTDGPVLYELPEGQHMRLANVHISGTQGDGIFWSYT